MDIRQQIDEVLAKESLEDTDLKFLSDNIALLTSEECERLGFVKPEPTAGPEIPAEDTELANMPKRTAEEVQADLAARGIVEEEPVEVKKKKKSKEDEE